MKVIMCPRCDHRMDHIQIGKWAEHNYGWHCPNCQLIETYIPWKNRHLSELQREQQQLAYQDSQQRVL